MAIAEKGKELNGLQIKAAKLLAQGFIDADIAKECGRSKEWVSRQKKLAIFMAKVREFQEEINEGIKRDIRKSTKSTRSEGMISVDRFKEKLTKSSERLYNISQKILEKLEERIEYLEVEELKLDKVTPLLKQATDTATASTEMDKFLLGLDRLIKELEDVRKAAGITNGDSEPI